MAHEEKPKEVEVQVLSLKTNRKAKFKALDSKTVLQVWDQSYGEFAPPEQKVADDKFECDDGTSMDPYLGLSLAALHDQHICQNRHFRIVGGTGGA